MILDLRAGLTRYTEAAYRQHVYGFDATSRRLPGFFLERAARPDSAAPDVEQYNEFRHPQPALQRQQRDQFPAQLSWIKGKHSFKFGGDLRDIAREHRRAARSFTAAVSSHFNRDQLPQFPGIQQRTPAVPLPRCCSAILRAASSNTPRLSLTDWGYYGWYVQDDIRVTNRLTLNLGLRWDREGSPTERYNRMNRGWSFATADPTARGGGEIGESSRLPGVREPDWWTAVRRRGWPAS